MKEVDNGKAANITIRCSAELRERVELMQATRYYPLPFNQVLALLVAKGLEIEEVRAARDRAEEKKDSTSFHVSAASVS